MVAPCKKILEDETIRQYKNWRYADQQMRTEDMIKFMNVPDCEEGYPLFKSELPPGQLLQQHPDHPPPYFPIPEPRITRAFGNFMYSKLVSAPPYKINLMKVDSTLKNLVFNCVLL